MLEKVTKLTQKDSKVVEKVIQDENLHYMHMIFSQDEGMPEHNTNATVYMTVIRGTLALRLADQPTQAYPQGSVIKIPYDTRMLIRNTEAALLELIIIKAPAPKN